MVVGRVDSEDSSMSTVREPRPPHAGLGRLAVTVVTTLWAKWSCNVCERRAAPCLWMRRSRWQPKLRTEVSSLKPLQVQTLFLRLEMNSAGAVERVPDTDGNHHEHEPPLMPATTRQTSSAT
jgi:hypothetical protein